MKRAHPERYQVDVIGTPDPEDSGYFVLDLVYDFEARVAVAKLINKYEQTNRKSKADECRKALAATKEAHFAVYAKRGESPKRKSR